MQLCPVCHKEPANTHATWGVIPGSDCQRRRAANKLPDHPIEFTSKSIKEGRKEYAKSALQPWRSGELSKEYLQAYGTKGINPTAKEIKRAKNVWTDVNKGVDIGRSK